MTTKKLPDWRPLSELPAALEALRPALPDGGELKDAIANCLRSNLVPVRGRPTIEGVDYEGVDYDIPIPTGPFAPLGGHIGPDTNIKPARDFISIKRGPLSGQYLRAEADLNVVREWLRENCLRAGPGAGESPQDDVVAAFRAWIRACPQEIKPKKCQVIEGFNAARRKSGLEIIGPRPSARVWKEEAPQSWRSPGRRPS